MYIKHFVCEECNCLDIENCSCKKDHILGLENILIPVKECYDFEPIEESK